MVSASRTTKAIPSARTGTPRASATAGSTEAKTSGRASTASASATAAVKSGEDQQLVAETASRLPNSTDVVVPALALASEANRTPRPVANARTVPVATSRSATRRPKQADQQAAADAEDRQAEGDGGADEDRAGRAGEADVGQGVRGEGVLRVTTK